MLYIFLWMKRMVVFFFPSVAQNLNYLTIISPYFEGVS